MPYLQGQRLGINAQPSISKMRHVYNTSVLTTLDKPFHVIDHLCVTIFVF